MDSDTIATMVNTDVIREMEEKFQAHYGPLNGTERYYFAPGRVNLIGEHTDYNGGFVFPCPLDFGTYLIARFSGTDNVKMATANFDYKATIPVGQLDNKHGGEWVNYPLGMFDQLKKKGLQPKGMDMYYSGNIPNGAGLSSSASIELVTGFALNDLYQMQLPMIELVKTGQKAENEFVGMNCGIMDQFAVGMGKKDTAVFLDCETLDYENVPVELDNLKLVISNTNKPRKLTESKYNERRSECDTALEQLNQGDEKFNFLGKIPMEKFNELKGLIPDETVQRRALHVISEDERVLEAVEALKKGNMERFGELMNQSHDSLRDYYEVTGFELDTLVEEARKIDGVLGSRMTGAGFGGCTVSLVREDAVDIFKEVVGKNYQAKTNLTPEFYIAEIGEGTKRIK